MAKNQTDTVELNEITTIKGDPEATYGGVLGGNNTVLPFSPAIQYLSMGAKAKADADQFKYLQFQNNMKEFYANFDDIKVDGLMEKDYPEITSEYAQLANDIAENYDIIRNPMKNQQKFAELKSREAQLRGRISRSKQDVAYRDFNNKFIQSHPEFNTPDNVKAVNEFSNGVIGERKLFNLNTPFAYDPAERSKLANGVAQQKLKDEQTKGKYITASESLKYLEDEYDRAWDALGAGQDKTGRPITQAAMDAYQRGGLLKDPNQFAAVDRQIGRSLMYQDQFVKSLRPNEVELQEDSQKFQSWQNSLNRSLQKDLAADKEVQAAGRDYNEALTSGFSTGYVRPALLQNLFGDSNEVQMTKDQIGADGVTMEKVVNKIPKIQVIGSSLTPDGKLVVKRVDNSSGKPVNLPDVTMNFEEAREAFKNISGSNNAGKVADAAEQYRKKYKLGLNPELNEMQKHFDFQNPVQPKPAATKPKKITGL